MTVPTPPKVANNTLLEYLNVFVEGSATYKMAARLLHLETLLSSSAEALESGEACLLLEASNQRAISSSFDVHTDSWKKYDSRARTAAIEADQLRALVQAVKT
jgi:hypothetical protein